MRLDVRRIRTVEVTWRLRGCNAEAAANGSWGCLSAHSSIMRFGAQTADVGKERRWTIVDVESLERVEGEELK
jgi:hypothetical protein